LYSAISDTSDPQQAVFWKCQYLLATAIQSFEIITHFKEKAKRRLRLWKELASFYVYLQVDPSSAASIGLQVVG
jgi:hypothetical protein